MGKKTFIFSFTLLWLGMLSAQSGVNIRAGVGTMITNESSFTHANGAHYGWRGALFARLGASDTWFFDPGLSYEVYNLESSERFDPFENKAKMHFLKGYMNLTTFLIRTRVFKLRLSGGGNLSYLARIDENPSYVLEDFNDATLGVNGGLGLDFWFITLDVGYEHALTDFFSTDDLSSNRFWTLSTGFFF